jgi:hypothetical protein
MIQNSIELDSYPLVRVEHLFEKIHQIIANIDLNLFNSLNPLSIPLLSNESLFLGSL